MENSIKFSDWQIRALQEVLLTDRIKWLIVRPVKGNSTLWQVNGVYDEDPVESDILCCGVKDHCEDFINLMRSMGRFMITAYDD